MFEVVFWKGDQPDRFFIERFGTEGEANAYASDLQLCGFQTEVRVPTSPIGF